MIPFLNAIWAIMCEMSPYLLLGFFIAGLMQAFVPRSVYARHLSRQSMGSVIKAAALGVPLPLCSCGVLPTALSLRREGASKGATTAFLIATPQTGVDSIAATYSLLGLPFALVRPIAALATSVLGGWAACRFLKEDDATAQESCAQCASENSTATGFVPRLWQALRYGFFEMMQDVGRWLVIGLIIAAAITILVPEGFFLMLGGYPALNMLVVLLVSVPMYVCATGSIPIAMSLMLKGLSPGAALVLLMAGPACNVASLMVVRRAMGGRAMMIYLAALVVGAVAFGLAVDYLLPAEWFALPQYATQLADSCCHSAVGCHDVNVFNVVCAVALIAMLVVALGARYFGQKHLDNNENKPNSNTMQTIRIEGMNCNHCRMAVEKALQQVAGVESVEVSLQQKQARVEGPASLQELRKAVIDAGFEVVE
mgnify:CR=1 FL=1